ncbi:MAG: hypothetical protein ACRDPC_10165 [Solirubrobacteraceae bacterium]
MVVGGVAVGAFALLGAEVAGYAARDRALRDGIANAPSEQRGIRAKVFETRVDADDPDAFDGQGGAGPPPGGPVREAGSATVRALPVVGYQREVVRGVVVSAAPRLGARSELRLVALDDPRSWLTLTAGLDRADAGMIEVLGCDLSLKSRAELAE